MLPNTVATKFIPKPVWTVGFALEQTLHVVTLAVFSFANFKTASAYLIHYYQYYPYSCIFGYKRVN
jgi:hypothetical protein